MHLEVPEYIRTLIPYVPGKPIEETKREYKIRKVIKLASNENPLGPSPLAVKALRLATKEIHRYPDGSGYNLKKTLSAHLGISPSQIILGNGSNDVIDHLVRTYCQPGDSIVTHQGAFLAYRVCAQVHGVRTHEVPVNTLLQWDVEELLQQVQADPRAKIVFLANPNNPTGAYFNTSAYRALVQGLSRIRGGSVILALDYAYWEYVKAKDLPPPSQCIKEYPLCVVLRTFSKIHGLAGLRVGYGIGPTDLILNLEKVRQPFNVSSLAQAAAEAALSDSSFIEKSKRVNAKGMAFWHSALNKLGIPFWKSEGNFILADVQTGLGKSGPEVFETCLTKGVIFRPLVNYGFPGTLRISIGTPEENLFAAQALGSLKESKKAKKKRPR